MLEREIIVRELEIKDRVEPEPKPKATVPVAPIEKDNVGIYIIREGIED